MYSQLVIVDLDCFSKLLEKVHVCHQGSKSKLSKICMVNEANNITFECCDLKLSVDKFHVISSEIELQSFNPPNYDNGGATKELQYEEVIFIDDIREPKSLTQNFESVFVNVEEVQNRMSEETLNCHSKLAKISNETDPLLVEQTVFPRESISILEKKLSSNVFKVSAKNFLPKVVDWSSGSIESISNEITPKEKMKYPSVLICEFCGLQFNGKDRVYKFFHHRNQFHTQEIKYICPICQKLYWGERELSAHVVSHLGKEHICEVCGITVQRKNDLIRHLLTHENKKFRCRFCSKMFRRKDHLKIHERIHTGEHPYECKKCGTGFPQKHQLNWHTKKCKVASTLQEDVCVP